MPIPTHSIRRLSAITTETDRRSTHVYNTVAPTYFFSHLPINFFSTRKIRSPPNRSGEYSS